VLSSNALQPFIEVIIKQIINTHGPSPARERPSGGARMVVTAFRACSPSLVRIRDRIHAFGRQKCVLVMLCYILLGSNEVSFLRVPGRNHSVSSKTSFHSSFSLEASVDETPAAIVSSGQLLSMGAICEGSSPPRRMSVNSTEREISTRTVSLMRETIRGHQQRSSAHGR